MSLIGEERKKTILDQVNRDGKIYVSILAKEMKVSTETIRKYLDELENLNKLRKVYGGAVKTSLNMEESPIAVRRVSNTLEKEIIAREAAKLVDDYDSIILDEGSTPLKMVEFLLNKKNLTIVTSSLPIVSLLVDMELKKIFKGKIIFIGGMINSTHARTTGSIAEEFMKDIHVNKSFISTEGISLIDGVTDFDPDKALLSRKFILNSQFKYVLADHAKLNNTSFYRICNFNELTGVICDETPPVKWNKYIKEHNISWVTPSSDNNL